MNRAWFSNKSGEGNFFDNLPKPAPPEPYSGPPRSLVAQFSTPHDNVLAAIHAQVDTAHVDEEPYIKADVMHDPYDGSAIGDVMLSNPALHPDVDIKQPAPSKKEEEIWDQLSTVLNLQAQIAARHLQMEGIGTRGDGKGKGKGKGKGAQSQISLWEAMGSNEGLVGEKARRGDEDEGVELSPEAEEEQRNREREEEFAKLAHQFEGRKEGIIEIMDQVCHVIHHRLYLSDLGQLDDLSKALTKFHHLQVPKIDFGSDSSSSGDNHKTSSSTIAPSSDPSRQRNLPPVSHLILNKMEPGTQQHFIESPVSASFDHLLPQPNR